jgi:hypothetical protein
MSDFVRLPDPEVPPWLGKYDAGPTMPDLDNRSAACLVLSDLDYDSQLAAIHFELRRHRQADEAFEKEIAEIDQIAKKTSGIRNQRAVDEWVDRVHRSVYEDAARSMAAIGMLAPMMESVFHQAFQGMRRESHERLRIAPAAHARWERPAEDQWDCHYVWSNGRRSTNLVAGIMQLADATGLKAHLPSDIQHTLQALFEYRNKMFHHGFEWPVEERQRFATRISEAGWPSDWFSHASSGDKPWVFYMSEVFIQHTVRRIDLVIEGIGAYCKRQFFPSDPSNEAPS